MEVKSDHPFIFVIFRSASFRINSRLHDPSSNGWLRTPARHPLPLTKTHGFKFFDRGGTHYHAEVFLLGEFIHLMLIGRNQLLQVLVSCLKAFHIYRGRFDISKPCWFMNQLRAECHILVKARKFGVEVWLVR